MTDRTQFRFDGWTLIHAALGNLDKACDALRLAPMDESQWVKVLTVDPRMDPLREQPCFAEVAEALKTPRAR